MNRFEETSITTMVTAERGAAVAGSVKCISCGYDYVPRTRNERKDEMRVKSRLRVQKALNSASGGVIPADKMVVIDDRGSSSAILEAVDENLQQQQYLLRKRQQQQYSNNTNSNSNNGSNMSNSNGYNRNNTGNGNGNGRLSASNSVVTDPSVLDKYHMSNGMTHEEYNRREAEAFLQVQYLC